MKRIFFPVILLLSISYFVAGQSVSVDWGVQKDLDKGTFIQKVIGADDNGFYALRSEGLKGIEEGNMYLEFFSMTMKERESSNTLVLPSIKGNPAFFIDMFYLKEKLILFTEVSDHSTMRRELYVQYMSQEGTAKNQPIKIGSLPLSNKLEDGFTVKLSEDKTQILVVYHSTFEAYAGEPFTIKVIDENLTETFSKEIALPFADKKMIVGNYILGKSGNVYMSARTETTTKSGKNTVVKYTNNVVVYNKLKREINYYEVNKPKFNTLEIIFALDKEENVVVFASMTPSNKATLAGYYNIKIDPKAQKLLSDPNDKFNMYAFTKPDLSNIFNSKRYEGFGTERYNFKLKDLMILDNGSAFLFCENFFYTTKDIIDPKTKEQTSISYSNYNDIFVIAANADGTISGKAGAPQRPFQVITKQQSGTNEYGLWSSYYLSNQGSKIKLIFNDVSKQANVINSGDKIKTFKTNVSTNPGGSACVVTIYSDSSMEKDYLFADPNQDYVTIPKLFCPWGSNLIVFAQNGKQYKFGSFFFE